MQARMIYAFVPRYSVFLILFLWFVEVEDEDVAVRGAHHHEVVEDVHGRLQSDRRVSAKRPVRRLITSFTSATSDNVTEIARACGFVTCDRWLSSRKS